MAKHIQGSINKIQSIIKHGKLKHKKIKLKKQVFDELLSPETLKVVKGADVIHKIKRKHDMNCYVTILGLIGCFLRCNGLWIVLLWNFMLIVKNRRLKDGRKDEGSSGAV